MIDKSIPLSIREFAVNAAKAFIKDKMDDGQPPLAEIAEAFEDGILHAYTHLPPHSSQPSGQLRSAWQKVTEDDRPKEYTQLLLWFESLKSMTTGYMVNGSWADENKNHLWCEPDYWAYMPARPSSLPPSAPTVELGSYREVKASERMPPVGEVCGFYEGRPARIKNEKEGHNYLLANGNYVSPNFVVWLEKIPSTVEPAVEMENNNKNKK